MAMRVLTDILPSRNRWRWWATGVCYNSALSFSPRGSPPHCHVTSFVSRFNFPITSQEQSSAAVATRARATHTRDAVHACLREWVFFFLSPPHWVMTNMWQRFDPVLGPFRACFKILCSTWARASLGNRRRAKHAVWCATYFIPIAQPSVFKEKNKTWLNFTFDMLIKKGGENP